MKKCPSCQRDVAQDASECPHCRIIFAKWIQQALRTQPPRISQPQPKRKQNWLTILIAGLAGSAILVGAYWYFVVSPRLRAISGSIQEATPSEIKSFKATSELEEDFDQAIAVPGDPLGLTVNGSVFVVGNRADPWGFIRLSERLDGNWETQNIPVNDPAYKQKMNFSAVTWNGRNYIGYTDGSWLQASSKNVFTVHDAGTLQILEHRAAPESLGCIVWDGSGYWGATRKNTEDATEQAFLYRLNDQFAVLEKWDPPGVGCQGLAWDGSNLWFADVFSHSIYVLHTGDGQPKVLQTYNTSFNYLSGIAFDGRDVWVSEYGNKKLHRMSPKLTASLRGSAPPSEIGQVENIAEQQSAPEQTPAQQIPSEQKTVDQPKKARDSYSASKSPPYPENEATVIEYSAEARDGNLYGSWKIYFGGEFFAGNKPQQDSVISIPIFAHYRFAITGGDLRDPIVHEYDAQPGENVMNQEMLASNLSAGKYTISLFIHVQFVDREGTNRIINDSALPLDVEF